MKEYTCCFFGHRGTAQTQELTDKIRGCVEALILNYGVNVFLFGSKSKFDDLCYTVVTELKEKYPHIVRVYVRAEFSHKMTIM